MPNNMRKLKLTFTYLTNPLPNTIQRLYVLGSESNPICGLRCNRYNKSESEQNIIDYLRKSGESFFNLENVDITHIINGEQIDV